MSRIDTYQQVTDRIVAALEAGAAPWRKGWQSGGAGLSMPLRHNGDAYRGINVLLLWMSASAAGYRGRHWMTFKQALELGGAVRKGEKSTQIVFFKKLDVERENDAGEREEVSIPMLRTYCVFNVDQIDGLPARYAPPVVELVAGQERDAAREAMLRSCGADIREHGDAAYYEPAADRVTMPEFALFASAGDYLATLAHELCHWTGHKSRLDRDMRGTFGSPDYAREELVAELGAAFTGARLGIVGEHIDNHAAYLASWLKALKGDKKAIFKAAAAAQLAADMVLANAGEAAAPAPMPAPIPAPMPAPLPAVGQLALAI